MRLLRGVSANILGPLCKVIFFLCHVTVPDFQKGWKATAKSFISATNTSVGGLSNNPFYFALHVISPSLSIVYLLVYMCPLFKNSFLKYNRPLLLTPPRTNTCKTWIFISTLLCHYKMPYIRDNILYIRQINSLLPLATLMLSV